jgi:hypothetical protein
MVEILRHPRHWKPRTDILHGRKADWERLFGGYQAAVDWPVVMYYKDLMTVYPEAKVILTVRDPDNGTAVS